MRFLIVTGMSGSGKSEVMSVLEDIGYYCIDNLPPELIPKMYDMSLQSQGALNHVAIGVDARGYNFEKNHKKFIEKLEELSDKIEILFLDASDDVLVRRYKMTRKRHPLSKDTDVLEGIKKERELLLDLKEKADIVIDTSDNSKRSLGKRIVEEFYFKEKRKNITVTISSFGFKHGIPLDADLVFDVRFLPNPYYVPELKEKTGNDRMVREFVMNSKISVEFFNKLADMVNFLLPNYEDEGKNHLKIAIGCTGGRHRSVTFANLLYEHLLKSDYYIVKNHRDIELTNI